MEVSVIYIKYQGPQNAPYVGRRRCSLKEWNNYMKQPGGGVAQQYGWSPNKVEILEDTSSLSDAEHRAREVYWINFYAKIYGIHPRALALAHSKDFVNKYPKGSLTNTHDYDGSSGTVAAREKYLQEGPTDSQIKQLQDRRAKCHETRISRARKCLLDDGFIGNKPEIVEHTKLPRGTVSAAMSKAARYGEFVSAGWTFKIIEDDTNREC